MQNTTGVANPQANTLKRTGTLAVRLAPAAQEAQYQRTYGARLSGEA